MSLTPDDISHLIAYISSPKDMESFIARRLYKNGQGSRKVSRPAVLIAQAGVALGLAVMLVTIAVSFGF